MVVFIVHLLGVLTFKTKGDTPVSTDIDSPSICSVSFQFVKPKAGKSHIPRLSGSMKSTKYETESFRMLPLDSGSASSFEETSEAPVLEAPNHLL